MIVNKDKNIMTFEIAEGKVYHFDINSGELLGLRQKPISYFPPAIIDYFKKQDWANITTDNLVDCLTVFSTRFPSRMVLELWKEYTKVLDLLSTIGYNIFKISGRDGFERENLDFVAKHYREFCAVFRENPSVKLRDFRRNLVFDCWVKKYNLVFNDFLTKGTAEWLYRNCYAVNWNDREMEIAIYYINRGAFQFLGYNFAEKINYYFHICKELEKEPKKAKDFIREWVEINMSYQIVKDTIDEKHLTENQMCKKNALAFENDEFTVIIPTTPKQFVDEGEAQDNCVARSYMPRVIRGETYIVFIRRKKEPDKSFITCEVDTNGRIQQYLARFNHHVSDSNANSFRDAYQKYLLENWGE